MHARKAPCITPLWLLSSQGGFEEAEARGLDLGAAEREYAADLDKEVGDNG